MMIVRLFCPECALAATKKLPYAEIGVPVPVARVADDGRYEVRCQAGHVKTVFLDNLKFELLFEMGLNALIDGYPREAVSSFASSLERYYEFYWNVVMTHLAVPEEEAAKAWKTVSKQSERQLGMYVTAYLLLMKEAPALLNPNSEVRFRNDVIHGGYIPSYDEAVAFGNSVMKLINQALDELRSAASDALTSTYKRLSPRPKDESKEDELQGVVNVLTAVDVRYPPKEAELRVGNVENHFERILRDREPHRMQLLSEDELRKRRPDVEVPKRGM
jgi:hypothetical protein